MCTYISVVLPPEADAAACREVFKLHKLALRPLTEGGPPNGVERGEQYFFTAQGHCDCGTRLGSFNELQNSKDDSEDQRGALVADLKKKGWSNARIERRLAELDRLAEKSGREKDGQREHAGTEIPTWLQLIDELVGSRRIRYLGVSVNQYSGSLGSPRFAVERAIVQLNSVTSEFLEHIAEKRLYVIQP